jgi:hypothetical protein
VIVLEEAAHLKPALFHNVIVPLLTVQHTAMLAITSPGDEMNYVSILQDLKRPDGSPFLKNIAIGVVCDKCKEENNADCKHKLRRLPPWKTEERHDLVLAIYGQQNKEAMMREAGGMVVSSHRYLFEKKFVDAFKNSARYHFKYEVQLVEIGIDPSGGGTQSDYVIVSKCVDDGNDVVRDLKHMSKTAPSHRGRTFLCVSGASSLLVDTDHHFRCEHPG